MALDLASSEERTTAWGRLAAGIVLVLLLTAVIGVGGLPAAHWTALGGREAAVESPQVIEGGRGALRAWRRLAVLRPRGLYLVVDTQANRLRVHRDGELLRAAACSTGTGRILRDPRGGRLWVFATPTGERRIRRKVADPVWVKPDWAFVEQGEKPPRDPRERRDEVSLGDYGLYLGDGYIIHGTLFESLLGRPATHGCIRLGGEDLRWIYDEVPVGAPVYLY